MMPPETVVNPAAWDTYWRDQFTHGVAGLADLFCEDGKLVDIMRANGLNSVLCIGSGSSQEPLALKHAGFDVTTLDLSPFVTEMAQRTVPQADFLAQLIGNRSQRTGGTLKFVVGDLCDSALCPGPFDVIIERRTLQLYPPAQRARALSAVTNRLASRGIFFSHSHDGRWRPPAPRQHAWARDIAALGWPTLDERGDVSERVVWLFVTTG